MRVGSGGTWMEKAPRRRPQRAVPGSAQLRAARPGPHARNGQHREAALPGQRRTAAGRPGRTILTPELKSRPLFYLYFLIAILLLRGLKEAERTAHTILRVSL